MSSVNRDDFASSFTVWMTFISFSCLIALIRSFNRMFTRNGENGHPYLTPCHRGKVFGLSPLSMMLSVGFLGRYPL